MEQTASQHESPGPTVDLAINPTDHPKGQQLPAAESAPTHPHRKAHSTFSRSFPRHWWPQHTNISTHGLQKSAFVQPVCTAIHGSTSQDVLPSEKATPPHVCASIYREQILFSCSLSHYYIVLLAFLFYYPNIYHCIIFFYLFLFSYFYYSSFIILPFTFYPIVFFTFSFSLPVGAGKG